VLTPPDDVGLTQGQSVAVNLIHNASLHQQGHEYLDGVIDILRTTFERFFKYKKKHQS